MSDHTISNKDLSVTVNSLGAELISLKSAGQELMWQADKNVWARYAPVLFPIVGRLKDDRFTYEDSGYKMNQHGFARDREFTPVEEKENGLEFELTANEESLSVYPFHFSLRIRYELKENVLTIRYIVFNPDNKPLFFSIGAHPGFNCRRAPGESLNDIYLEFPGAGTLLAEKLDNGLQSGKTYEVKTDNGKLKLNTTLFDNDALVFKNTQVEKVILASEKTDLKLILECKAWPYFGVWSKKDSDAFVCLEPWYGIADNIDTRGAIDQKEGIIEVQPYKIFEAAYSLKIDTGAN
jgi:galactose mutarotase-like enzyme